MDTTDWLILLHACTHRAKERWWQDSERKWWQDSERKWWQDSERKWWQDSERSDDKRVRGGDEVARVFWLVKQQQCIATHRATETGTQVGIFLHFWRPPNLHLIGSLHHSCVSNKLVSCNMHI